MQHKIKLQSEENLPKRDLPEGFYEIALEFTYSIIKEKPDDIIEYAFHYFENLLKLQQEVKKKNSIEKVNDLNYKEFASKYIQELTEKIVRQQKPQQIIQNKIITKGCLELTIKSIKNLKSLETIEQELDTIYEQLIAKTPNFCVFQQHQPHPEWNYRQSFNLILNQNEIANNSNTKELIGFFDQSYQLLGEAVIKMKDITSSKELQNCILLLNPINQNCQKPLNEELFAQICFCFRFDVI